jgi:UPF0176 protein
MNSSTDKRRVQVAAFYKFCRIADHASLREPLLDLCTSHGVRGTLLLAHEGINGTLAGTAEAIAAVLDHLRSVPELECLDVKLSRAAEMPFHRLKIRLKTEIVTMGVEDVDPKRSAGAYVSPSDWNDLISDPDTIVIDTRNDYEVAIGTFRGALDPKTTHFRQFPDWVERHRDDLQGRRVAMFCTGGIRCEKATAYVKSLGLDEIYHLKGGILRYLEEVPEEQSLWEGECFVFDERVSVVHGLREGEAELCRACRRPLTPDERTSPEFREGVSCPHCHDRRSDEDRIRYAERQRQVELAEKRGTAVHIGQRPGKTT